MALTLFAIQNAKPKGKPYKLSDGGGLHLLITESSKLWRFRYRFSGKENMLSLGTFPEVSIADARAKRDDARTARQETGSDPRAQQRPEDGSYNPRSKCGCGSIDPRVNRRGLGCTLRGLRSLPPWLSLFDWHRDRFVVVSRLFGQAECSQPLSLCSNGPAIGFIVTHGFPPVFSSLLFLEVRTCPRLQRLL
jgi:hypothetical protein